MRRKLSWGLLSGLFTALVCAQPAAAGSIAPADAAKVFAEMRGICGADGGRFWGVTLCGPVLFVDPMTRDVVANSPDAEGHLKREGDVWVGTLPPSENISNAPMTWAGTAWTELMWPLMASTEDRRRVSLAHEMFHRVQPKLGLIYNDGDNSQLDTLEGRYLLELEWRALARALQAKTDTERRAATIDALNFRAERYRLFPKAAENEQTIDYNEGLAEYTGLHIGLSSPQARVSITLEDINLHLKDDSFVRTFAYASGPAYGLLLDRYAPRWRTRLPGKPRIDVLLREGLHAPVPTDLAAAAKSANARYDDGSLRTAELAREDARQKRLAAFRAKYLDGPHLILPMHHANVSFVPMDLQPLDDKGVVYTKLRVSAEWGVLEATKGALLQPGFSGVVVAVAPGPNAPTSGDGWTLTLKPGWKVVAAPHAGDFTISQ